MKIKAHALLIDGQDGGYTVHLFATKGEMEKYRKEAAEESGRKYDPEDEYENGYTSFHPVTIEVDDKGKFVHCDGMSFGQ